MFIAGIVILLVGGLLGGLGQNLGMLIVSRVLIGVGTSSAYPSAMVLIRRRAEAARLAAPPGNVLGGLAIAGQATLALGPTIGGLLVGWFDWRAAFFLNVPLALAALAMAIFWLPKDTRPESGGVRAVATRIDAAGIVGSGVAVSAVLVFLLGLPRFDWVALAIVVVVGVGLVLWELRASHPFLDVRMLASNGALARTYLRSGLTLLGIYVILCGLPEWMEVAHHLSPERSRLLLIRWVRSRRSSLAPSPVQSRARPAGYLCGLSALGKSGHVGPHGSKLVVGFVQGLRQIGDHRPLSAHELDAGLVTCQVLATPPLAARPLARCRSRLSSLPRL